MKFDHDQGVVWIRQSWLDTATKCNERGRQAIVRPEWDEAESDSTFLGTACHETIEHILNDRVRIEDAADFCAAWMEGHVPGDIQWKKYDGLPHIIALARNNIAAFIDGILPQLPARDGEARTEVEFKFLTDTFVNDWRIGFTGTIDYVAPYELWDWKTASRPYSPYEKQQQAVQPSVYAEAARRGHLPGFEADGDDVIPFYYGVMRMLTNHSEPQIVTVARSRSHFDWVMQQVTPLVRMATTMLNHEWSKNDQHFLCSPKWCAWWSICKGASINHDANRYPDQIDLKGRK